MVDKDLATEVGVKDLIVAQAHQMGLPIRKRRLQEQPLLLNQQLAMAVMMTCGANNHDARFGRDICSNTSSSCRGQLGYCWLHTKFNN